MPSGPTIRRLSEELSIDFEHDCLSYKGEVVDLDPKAFQVLRLLCEHWPARRTRTQILDAVWKDTTVEENNVYQAILKIREMFRELGVASVRVEQKRNSGYRLILPDIANKQEEEIERVILSETNVTAVGFSGAPLWTYRFQPSSCSFTEEELVWRVQRVDLLGDGDIGVLVTARFREPIIANTMFYFTSNGNLKWQLDAEPALSDRRGIPFERAWVYKHVVCTCSTNGCTVWAALGNDAGWAGCVLRIDSQGSAAVQLANAGFVERICPVTSEDGEFLIVCGENNDFDQSFIALLGVHDPPACSIPGDRLVYRFGNAPTGVPRKYILFPMTELISARAKPYGHATHIAQHTDGVIVNVETGQNGAHFRYHFSKSLEPRYVFPSGSHEFEHQALERAGAVTHAWLNCPERQAPLLLRIWKPGSGWFEQSIRWRDDPWRETQIRSH